MIAFHRPLLGPQETQHSNAPKSCARTAASHGAALLLVAHRGDRFCGHHRPSPHHKPPPPRGRRSRPHGQGLRHSQHLRCFHPKAPQDALVARDRFFSHCRRSVFSGRPLVPLTGRCSGVEASPVDRGEGEACERWGHARFTM